MSLLTAWRKPPEMWPATKAIALAAKGFMPEDEGLRLYELAWTASANGPCLEVGSYCGRSALFLGEGCRTRGRHGLYSVDHHRGSEEQQPGQPYHDPELVDASGSIDTLPHFLANIRAAGLDEWIFPIVGPSAAVAASWPEASLSLVFIDGGHAKPTVEADVGGWSRCLMPGGLLCMHDIYQDPAGGGQAPREVFDAARAGNHWKFEGLFGSLGILRHR